MSVSGLRLDLHNHTRFSGDGLLSPAALLEAAGALGIDCIAVTDHNCVRGAMEALALAESDASLPRVIPGIELLTADGEIIGLYVQDDIPAGLPLERSVELIKEQGGLVYLPHPYDRLRRGTISRSARLRAAGLADIIEVVNGRSLGPRTNHKASVLAGRTGKPGGAGSDAHRKKEVGQACVVVDEYPTRETLVALLRTGKVMHGLNRREYTLNWGTQGLSPVTRMRRRVASHF